jgi:hypothetical protein
VAYVSLVSVEMVSGTVLDRAFPLMSRCLHAQTRLHDAGHHPANRPKPAGTQCAHATHENDVNRVRKEMSDGSVLLSWFELKSKRLPQHDRQSRTGTTTMAIGDARIAREFRKPRDR